MNGWSVVSTFAGVGGFDLAFERAGIPTVATVEIDKAARGVLTDRWPDTHHFTDIKDVTADDLRSAGFVPERGILTGGFPCQDLSVAGRRAGMGEGTRSGLFWQLDRLMAELAPAWVVFENVPGLLSSTCPCTGDGTCQLDDRGPVRCPGELHTIPGGACPGGCIATHGGTMGAVLGAMGHRGYGFAYRVLDAQRFGVPQRRRRVFIVGRLGDDGRAPAQVLAEFEGSLGDFASRPTAWEGLARRPRGRARAAGRLLADTGVVRALSARQGESGVDLTDAEAGHVIETYTLEPESGQGADLRARPVDVAGAVTATSEAESTDRGTRIVQTYRKAGRAQTNQDDETWTEADVANTVNTFDVGDTRATELVVEASGVAFNQRDEARVADETAYAIQATPGIDEQLVQVTPINADALRGEGAAATPSADAEGRVRLRDPGLGVGAAGDPAGTLAAAGPGAVAVFGDVTHTLTHEGHDASEDGTGRGTPIIAATLTSGSHAPNVSAPGRRKEDDENLVVSPTLQAGGNDTGGNRPPGTTVDTAESLIVSPAVTAKWAKGTGGPSGDEAQNLTPMGATVRRLTPLECERLQGFPDNWTATSNGKRQVDGPRYKQMGNSLAVPVAEWIAHRLVAVETSREES